MAFEVVARYLGPIRGVEVSPQAGSRGLREGILGVVDDWNIPTIPIGPPPIKGSLVDMPDRVVLVAGAGDEPADPAAIPAQSVEDVLRALSDSEASDTIVVHPTVPLDHVGALGWARDLYDALKVETAIVAPTEESEA